MSFLSTEGWAEKSKSASVNGDGKRGEAGQARPPTLGDRGHLDGQQPLQEVLVAELRP